MKAWKRIMATVEETRKSFGEGDAKRDAGLTTPENIERLDNLSYGPYETWNQFDLYRLKGTTGCQRAIVNIHGGGWVYGTKEIYQYYGMSLAQKGFTFVNFNYRLAPEYPFPAALEDINAMFTWLAEHGTDYGIDLQNLFAVGDSAGGQLLSQYLAMLANPEFQKLYDFKLPSDRIRIRAAALNCGVYDVKTHVHESLEEVLDAYTGAERDKVIPKMDTMRYITPDFPPSFIMTAHCDFLRKEAEPMYERLKAMGVPCEYHIYGAEGKEELGHIFHCNMYLAEAAQCNEEECSFFEKYAGKK